MKKYLQNRLFVDSFLVIILSNSTHFINLIIQILLSRTMNFVDFSTYYSSLSLFSFILVPALSYRMYLQEYISKINKFKNKIKFIFEEQFKFIILILFFFLIINIFSKSIIDNLKMPSYWDFFILSITSAIIMLSFYPYILNNENKNYKTNYQIDLFCDVIRLIIILLCLKFINIDLRLVLYLGLFFASSVLFFSYLALKEKLKNLKATKFEFRFNKIFSVNKNLVLYLIYSLKLPILMSSDIIISKIYFSAEISSNYIVASSLSKIIFILPSALHLIIFRESNLLSKINVFKIFTLFFFLICSALVFLMVFKDILTTIIYGKEFIYAITYIVYLAPAAFFLSLSKVLSDILFSRKKYTVLLIIFCTLIILLLLNLFNLKSAEDLALNYLIANFLLFFCIFSFFIKTFNFKWLLK